VKSLAPTIAVLLAELLLGYQQQTQKNKNKMQTQLQLLARASYASHSGASSSFTGS
jgi:hypothetical protein